MCNGHIRSGVRDLAVMVLELDPTATNYKGSSIVVALLLLQLLFFPLEL